MFKHILKLYSLKRTGATMGNDDNHLSPQQRKVLRDGATEAPGSGALLDNKQDGSYHCAACNAKLFDSDTKFESKQAGLQGWPSFDQAIDGAIELKDDSSAFMHRTEAICANCDGHLGHVFDAADSPSGTHFCINSCSLDFEDTEGNRTSGDSN